MTNSKKEVARGEERGESGTQVVKILEKNTEFLKEERSQSYSRYRGRGAMMWGGGGGGYGQKGVSCNIWGEKKRKKGEGERGHAGSL